MMLKVIKLYNRDGADLNLVTEDGNIWHFEVDTKHEYILRYMRFGIDEHDNSVFTFADPSGGPMIRVGSNISENKVVKSIYFDNDNKLTILTE